MAQARLDSLDAESRRLLRAASVLGETFWRGALSSLLGAPDPSELAVRVEGLVRREILVRHASARFVGEDEIAFRHALVREAAYALLTDEDRALGHALAAEWLERAGESDPLTLAEHHERGAKPERAADWFRRAADQALEGHDLDAALARARRGLAAMPSGEVAGALRLVEASVHDTRGENAEALLRGREAMDLLPRGSSLWHRAAMSAAVASRRMGQRDDLRAIAGELAALEPGAWSAPDARRCGGRAALQLAVVGLLSLATAILDAAEGARAHGPDEPLGDVWLWAARGIIALLSRDPTHLLAGADDHIALAERMGDLRTACNLRFYVGAAANLVGAYDFAERHLRVGLAGSESLGISMLVPQIRIELAGAVSATRTLHEARAVLADALAGTRAQRDLFQEGRALERVSLLAMLDGELAEAEDAAREAVRLTEAAPPFRRHVAATLATVVLRRGRADEALELASAAVAATLEGGSPAWDDVALLVKAEALSSLGRNEEAERAIAEARDYVLELARSFEDQTWAEGFLTRVSANARTLALAREWLER
jgi:tetratricopeptide (TPR) repeat protein